VQKECLHTDSKTDTFINMLLEGTRDANEKGRMISFNGRKSNNVV